MTHMDVDINVIYKMSTHTNHRHMSRQYYQCEQLD